MTARSLVSMLSILFATICCATEPAAPPITDETLNGTWEAVLGEMGVVRLDIRPQGNSYLADVDSTDKEGRALYKLVQRRVHDGKVLLRFRKLIGSWQPEEVTLDGYGYLSGLAWSGADLRVKYIQGSLGSCDLHLTKGTITDILARMSKQAEDLIEHARSH